MLLSNLLLALFLLVQCATLVSALVVLRRPPPWAPQRHVVSPCGRYTLIGTKWHPRGES